MVRCQGCRRHRATGPPASPPSAARLAPPALPTTPQRRSSPLGPCGDCTRGVSSSSPGGPATSPSPGPSGLPPRLSPGVSPPVGRRPRASSTPPITTPATPSAISTHPHQGTPLDVPPVVEVGCTVTVVAGLAVGVDADAVAVAVCVRVTVVLCGVVACGAVLVCGAPLVVAEAVALSLPLTALAALETDWLTLPPEPHAATVQASARPPTNAAPSRMRYLAMPSGFHRHGARASSQRGDDHRRGRGRAIAASAPPLRPPQHRCRRPLERNYTSAVDCAVVSAGIIGPSPEGSRTPSSSHV